MKRGMRGQGGEPRRGLRTGCFVKERFRRIVSLSPPPSPPSFSASGNARVRLSVWKGVEGEGQDYFAGMLHRLFWIDGMPFSGRTPGVFY